MSSLAAFPKTPARAFRQRRARLMLALESAFGSREHRAGAGVRSSASLRHAGGEVEGALLAAGWARPRNFAHSHFPFRAESHFLWCVGAHLEGAVVLLPREESPVLFLQEPDPSQFIWTGARPGLDAWAAELGLPCRPLSELAARLAGRSWATLPPQDEATAAWMSSLLGREVDAQSGPTLEGSDARLADALVELRLCHDDFGIEQMRATAAVTVHAHRRAMRATLGAETEARVRAELEAEFTAAGLGDAYPSIVTVHGEVLHAEGSRAALGEKDLLLCDAGAESPEGWASDVTRTWPVSGRFSATQASIVELVVQVQREAIDGVVEGASFVDLHLRAQEQMTEGLHDLGILRGGVRRAAERRLGSVFFPHGLGHLLGLDVHDMEDLGDRAGYGAEGARSEHPELALLRLVRRLRCNMVVTIEPGFYQVPALLAAARNDPAQSECIDWNCLERFSDVRGVRVEDDLRVTPSGAEVLSQGLPTTPAEIEAWMKG